MELPYELEVKCCPARRPACRRGRQTRQLEVGLNSEREKKFWLHSAIFKTLAYAAVFNYPLTSEEIYKYLFLRVQQDRDKENCYSNTYHCSMTNQRIKGALYELLLSGRVGKKEGYYFLRGMGSGVAQRKERLQISLKKLARAENFKNWARLIPTVKLIGVSGALAMENAHEDDDIDLFIVAQSGTVWITRFLTVILAEALGVRRRPEYVSQKHARASVSETIKDKICLNMFVDEGHMSIPAREQDLFSAHEVVQMVPIYNSTNTYERFLFENRWVKEFLPNAFQIQNSKFKINFSHITHHTSHITNFAEKIVRRAQLYYMRNKVTNEVLNNGYLRFHPVDARRLVLRRYKQIFDRCTKLYY